MMNSWKLYLEQTFAVRNVVMKTGNKFAMELCPVEEVLHSSPENYYEMYRVRSSIKCGNELMLVKGNGYVHC